MDAQTTPCSPTGEHVRSVPEFPTPIPLGTFGISTNNTELPECGIFGIEDINSRL